MYIGIVNNTLISKSSKTTSNMDGIIVATRLSYLHYITLFIFFLFFFKLQKSEFDNFTDSFLVLKDYK